MEKQNNEIPATLPLFETTLVQAAESCWPAVRTYILSNNGALEDARDVLQDAIMVVYLHARNGRLALTGTLEAYLMGVCKNKWLHRLREKKRARAITIPEPVEYTNAAETDSEWRQAARYRLYIEKLDELGDPCRRIIELDSQDVPLKEISQQLGYAYDYIRHKKSDCLNNLMKRIRQDKRFNDLV